MRSTSARPAAVRRALALARVRSRGASSPTSSTTPESDERGEGRWPVHELWQETFLFTDLRPPLTHPSPARYVEQHLQGIGRHEPNTRRSSRCWARWRRGMRATGRAADGAARAERARDARRAGLGRHAQCRSTRHCRSTAVGSRDSSARPPPAPSSCCCVSVRRPATGGLDGYRLAFSVVTAPTARRRCSSFSIPSAAWDHQRASAAPRDPADAAARGPAPCASAPDRHRRTEGSTAGRPARRGDRDASSPRRGRRRSAPRSRSTCRSSYSRARRPSSAATTFAC